MPRSRRGDRCRRARRSTRPCRGRNRSAVRRRRRPARRSCRAGWSPRRAEVADRRAGKIHDAACPGSPVSGSSNGSVKSPWTGRMRRPGKRPASSSAERSRVHARCRPADRLGAHRSCSSNSRVFRAAAAAKFDQLAILADGLGHFGRRALRGSPVPSASDSTRRARKSRRKAPSQLHRKSICTRFPFAAG